MLNQLHYHRDIVQSSGNNICKLNNFLLSAFTLYKDGLTPAQVSSELSKQFITPNIHINELVNCVFTVLRTYITEFMTIVMKHDDFGKGKKFILFTYSFGVSRIKKKKAMMMQDQLELFQEEGKKEEQRQILI